MFNNHLKIAWRNLLKHKAYSFINIAGLAVGLALLIALLTVSTQAIRAALANPVQALRYE